MMLLGAGAAAKKTYLDDVFKINTYIGNGYHPTLNTGGATSRDFDNGIDFTEGGLVIFRRTDSASWWQWVDSENGVEKSLGSNSPNALDTSRTNGLKTFNNDGFTVAWDGLYNSHQGYHQAFSFRKAKGFFDVVKWTGNATVRDISHNLGSVPGMIIIKNTSSNGMYWVVYHRSIGETKALYLNTTDGQVDGTDFFSGAPTDSVFKIGTNGQVNANGSSHVAYLFAGGESTNALARSVKLDGSGDYLQSGSSSDFTMGTGDFTVEGWFKKTNDSDNQGLFQITTDSDGLSDHNSNSIALAAKSTGLHTYAAGSNQSESSNEKFQFGGQWAHIAMVRSSGKTKVYANGLERMSVNDTYNYNGTYLAIGGYAHTGLLLNGSVSNFRVVKGTAVYTSSFKPPTQPLTSISGTVLLCCNNSSVTGTTTGSISSNGDPTASSDSPFDDPAGFVYGDGEDENLIKTGSYTGNGQNWDPTDSTPKYGLFVECGFEPQWVMLKRTSPTGASWKMVNCHTGLIHNGDGEILNPSGTSVAEEDDRIRAEPTGFRLTNSSSQWNYNGGTYVFVALRRPDSGCGKPPEVGTDAFAMDTGNGSSTIPSFDSGFPVDFAMARTTAAANNWNCVHRFKPKYFLRANTNDQELDHSAYRMNHDAGWSTGDYSGTQSWMWKRGPGFDVVAYGGNGHAGRYIRHGLGKTPEMIWLKNRSSGEDWFVYHKGLNGGSSPGEYELHLNENHDEDRASNFFDTDPDATTFRVDSGLPTNYNGHNYVALLFASHGKISKLGSYTGNGSASGPTITLGFQPRYLVVKCATNNESWQMVDTLRGWGSGNDYRMFFNSNQAQNEVDIGEPTSTGFSITTTFGTWNANGETYIYYAHA